MKKCVIIMNPESGKKKKIKNYMDFYDILRKYGYDTDVFSEILNKKCYNAGWAGYGLLYYQVIIFHFYLLQ